MFPTLSQLFSNAAGDRERPSGDRAAEPGDEFAPSKANPHLALLCGGVLSRQYSTVRTVRSYGDRAAGAAHLRRADRQHRSPLPRARRPQA